MTTPFSAEGTWLAIFGCIVRKQDTCRDGDNAGSSMADVLRRYYTDAKGARLETINSGRKAIITSFCTILGIVVGVVRKF